jgi:hypothetical protein
MLQPEDIETIVTTQDLSVYLKEIVQKEERDLKIDIDYKSGELFMNCPGFSHDISVTTDPFGVRVISEGFSQDNNEIPPRPAIVIKPRRPLQCSGQLPAGLLTLKRVPETSERDSIYFC